MAGCFANPTDGIKKPIAPRTVPTDYFNRREFDRILAATANMSIAASIVMIVLIACALWSC
jgi:hypothetical protein